MEFVGLIVIVLAIAVLLIWRVRRSGTGEEPPIPFAEGDKPDHEDAEFEAARGRAPAGRR
jgi:hypothetical protein